MPDKQKNQPRRKAADSLQDVLKQTNPDTHKNGKIWYVGLDFGEQYPVAATALRGFGDNIEVRTLAIRQNALKEPQIRFSRWMQNRKSESVYELERALCRSSHLTHQPSFSESDDKSNDKEYLEGYLKSFLRLSEFYNSKSIMGFQKSSSC